MKYAMRMRWVGGLLLVAGGAVAQMSSLPATPSTSLPATPPGAGTVQAVAVPAAALTPSERARHAAEVVCRNGQVEVTASNSSLNLILREIARQTGMKITGGVREERVYGRYGPGRAGDVLASLLEGTGSNMLLREGGADSQAELVLTPRTGGVTPPNPNASGFSDEDPGGSARTQTMQPAMPWQSTPAVPSGMVQVGAQPTTAQAPQTPPPTGIIDPPAAPPTGDPGTLQGQPNAPASGATQPQSPNGVKTPQQIYEQLQQLRQQQQPPRQ